MYVVRSLFLYVPSVISLLMDVCISLVLYLFMRSSLFRSLLRSLCSSLYKCLELFR